MESSLPVWCLRTGTVLSSMASAALLTTSCAPMEHHAITSLLIMWTFGLGRERLSTNANPLMEREHAWRLAEQHRTLLRPQATRNPLPIRNRRRLVATLRVDLQLMFLSQSRRYQRHSIRDYHRSLHWQRTYEIAFLTYSDAEVVYQSQEWGVRIVSSKHVTLDPTFNSARWIKAEWDFESRSESRDLNTTI